MRHPSDSPAALFAAAIHPGRMHELAEMGLEVVARPGMAPPAAAHPGLFAVCRARGEGRLAVVSLVERVAPSRAVLEAEGIPCEGSADGVFIEVHGGPGGRRGLRITGPDRNVAPHVVLLTEAASPRRRARPRRVVPAAPERLPSEDTPPMPLSILVAAVYALRFRRQRSVREEYLRSVLQPTSGTPALRDDLQRAVADLERRQAAIPVGQDRSAALSAIVDDLASGVLTAAERAFILDPQRSSLELLDPTERDRYLGFAWEDGDFPGGPPGRNEARADQMFSALTRLRPER
ncbi:MAG: hypothetical protein ABJC89_26415, partial [Acidobacteriota bacterium]